MKFFLSIIFILNCSFGFSQTLYINKGKHLDAKDSMKITFELDSIIQFNTFPIEQLNSDPIKIRFTAMNSLSYIEEWGETSFTGELTFWGEDGKEIENGTTVKTTYKVIKE
jgi:hypothetical protein